jgi:hypothetical protein
MEVFGEAYRVGCERQRIDEARPAGILGCALDQL